MPQTKTRIRKAFTQFRGMQVLDGGGKEIPETMYIYFKDAIEDNQSPQIPVEAVEKLRDKYTLEVNDGRPPLLNSWIAMFVKDLEALLPKQEDDTN